MRKKQIVSTLLLLLTAMIWGSAFVAQSVGAQYVGPFTFLAVRSFLAVAVLLPVVSFLRRSGEVPARASGNKSRKRLFLEGGLLCGFFLFTASAAQQAGMAYTTAAKGSFITALYVVFVPFAGMLTGKRSDKKIWIGVFLGVIGLYLLCIKGAFAPEKGDALILLCALLYTGHILVIDRFSPYLEGVLLSCIQFFVCGMLSFVCMILFESPEWAQLKGAAMPILYAGVLSGGIGYTLQIVGQKNLDPTVASLTMSLESVFGALFGWILLGEALSARELLGCCLMFAAIVIAQLPDKKS